MADAAGPDWMALVVRRRKDVARDIVEFTLARPDGADLPAFEPGAHVEMLQFSSPHGPLTVEIAVVGLVL